MVTVTDDLGTVMTVPGAVTRVVSLVPSLTESVAATRPEALVGATQWCTRPVDLVVERIRGTKNPDVRRIVEIQPDLVLANREENRRRDVERLRSAGIPVWVTVTESVPQAMSALRRMFTIALQWGEPEWLTQCDALWAAKPDVGPSVVIPIWRDPWMVVGRDTFAGDLAARLGLVNLFAEVADRYPPVALTKLVARSPDCVLLPDEPYPFNAVDGPEAFPGIPCALVSGRALTWYGPSLLTARDEILPVVRSVLGR